MTEQWTEWKNHTPGPCPVPVGVLVKVEARRKFDGKICESDPFVMNEHFASCPTWEGHGCTHIALRYRTRISPAFEQLRQLAEQPAEAVTV